jgi:Tfp pilus assembly protein PilF
MKKIKQDVRQLCIALQRGEFDLDDARRLAEDLNQEILRARRRTILTGTLFVFLSFILAGAICKPRSATLAAAPDSSSGLSYIPKHTLPLDSLWVIDYQQKDLHSRIPALTQQPFSEEWVKHAAYHLIMGRQAMDENLPKEAVVHLEEVLTIFPELRGVHGTLGTIYLQMNKTAAAVPHLEAALDEGESLSVLNNLGAALMRTGRPDRAEELILRAHELNPQYPGVLKNLALLYREKEAPEKALAYFEEYLTLYHEDIQTAEIYADYLTGLNRREQAVEFLENYSRQNTGHALPLYLLLAKLEAQTTNAPAAVAALREMADVTTPNLALIRLNLDDFDSIRDTEEFQSLVHQIELAAVTLEEKQ